MSDERFKYIPPQFVPSKYKPEGSIPPHCYWKRVSDPDRLYITRGWELVGPTPQSDREDQLPGATLPPANTFMGHTGSALEAIEERNEPDED